MCHNMHGDSSMKYLFLLFLTIVLFACSDKAASWLFGDVNNSSLSVTQINNGIDIEKFQYNELNRNRIIAMLSAKDSAYVNFHVRQAIKFMIVEVLISLITALTFWTFIVPIFAGIALIILVVLEIICFFQVCSGKAKEPAIIRSLNFLK